MSFYRSSNYEPERSIGYLIRVINLAARPRQEHAIEAENLSMTHWQVLVSIYFNRALTGAALARDLAHDKGAMTRLVDSLEERGLVTRERSVEDRRVFKLTLTAAGRAAAERGRERVIECWNGWLDGWQHDEVETLIRMLQRLRTAIETAPETCA